jgi:hypothetical protein
MYTTTPYIDDRQAEGNWAGLRKTIEESPEWLIPLGRQSARSYAFRYDHPGLRAYQAALLRDMFRTYNADGLLIDGLGSVEDRFVAQRFKDPRGLVGPVVNQTMEIYRIIWDVSRRLKDDLLMEGGWHNPAFARPYAHTFRQGDEVPAFSAPYPAGGLVEHIDYATYQKAILDQRPNMGALTADEGSEPINLDWLRAGIALDSHVTMSFDLETLSNDEVAEYRGLLNHYDPFTGSTRFDRVLEPSVFVTRKDGRAYLGLLNRSASEQSFTVRLSDYGLSDRMDLTFFDVSAKTARIARGTFDATLPPRSFRLFVVALEPSVVFTSSSLKATRTNREIAVQLSGPAHVPGVCYVAVPRPTRVMLNDVALVETQDARPASGQYRFDARGGLLMVAYSHAQPLRLVVEG